MLFSCRCFFAFFSLSRPLARFVALSGVVAVVPPFFQALASNCVVQLLGIIVATIFLLVGRPLTPMFCNTKFSKWL